ncbi:hypothetical protein AAG565_15020 [Fontimonas sp. SYSU GA230001]|uniref:hypothetical protein n=1 Tax=Fontimonas sp. SYSU GA230001 TaxID=3142450 RepID=UPI0032B32FEA
MNRMAVAAALLVAASAASAQVAGDSVDEAPSAVAMTFDLLIVRPLSFVGLVAGTGLFVASLPLALIQFEAPVNPAKKFVVEPAKYTFTRPLGEMR